MDRATKNELARLRREERAAYDAGDAGDEARGLACLNKMRALRGLPPVASPVFSSGPLPHARTVFDLQIAAKMWVADARETER